MNYKLMALRGLKTASIVIFALASPQAAHAQYYTRAESIADRARDIRYEASSLQQRSNALQSNAANVRTWRLEVDNWANNTQEQARELQRQSQLVDRAAFFNNQASAITQANAQQIKTQGQAVYAASMQVSLRTQQLKSFERELWQWKSMLDKQEELLRSGINKRDTAKQTVAQRNTQANERLDALMKSIRVEEAAYSVRLAKVTKSEASLKGRAELIQKRRDALDKRSTDMDDFGAALDKSTTALDELDKKLDVQTEALHKFASAVKDAEVAHSELNRKSDTKPSPGGAGK